jgi:hypothetical protein
VAGRAVGEDEWVFVTRQCASSTHCRVTCSLFWQQCTGSAHQCSTRRKRATHCYHSGLWSENSTWHEMCIMPGGRSVGAGSPVFSVQCGRRNGVRHSKGRTTRDGPPQGHCTLTTERRMLVPRGTHAAGDTSRSKHDKYDSDFPVFCARARGASAPQYPPPTGWSAPAARGLVHDENNVCTYCTPFSRGVLSQTNAD